MSSAIQILPHLHIFKIGNIGKIRGIDSWYSLCYEPYTCRETIKYRKCFSGEFHMALKRYKKCKAFQPIDFKVADDPIVQPDLLVICDKIKKTYLDFALSCC